MLTAKQNTLHQIYLKIGQEAGLERILRVFYRKMTQDVLIGYFFDGKNLEHILSQQKAFLMRAMGATRSYQGKPPAKAHLELPNILKGHFDRRLRILEETLRAHGLNEEEIRAWVEFEGAFRDSIVREEGPKSP